MFPLKLVDLDAYIFTFLNQASHLLAARTCVYARHVSRLPAASPAVVCCRNITTTTSNEEERKRVLDAFHPDYLCSSRATASYPLGYWTMLPACLEGHSLPYVKTHCNRCGSKMQGPFACFFMIRCSITEPMNRWICIRRDGEAIGNGTDVFLVRSHSTPKKPWA